MDSDTISSPPKLDIETLPKTPLSEEEESAWEDGDHEIDEERIRSWIDKNESYNTLEYFEKYTGPIEDDVLELGAGHCWLSGKLSKRQSVDRVCAVEISEAQLRNHAPPALEYVDANLDVMEFYVGDFLNLEPFGEDEFDVVVFDSAFHHTYHPIELLNEVRRVIKPDGRVFLQREPTIYPVLTANRLLGPWGLHLNNNRIREQRQGETPRHNELIYSVPEYETFAYLAGFELELHPQLHENATAWSIRRPIVRLLAKRSQTIKRELGLRLHTRWFMSMQPRDLPRA